MRSIEAHKRTRFLAVGTTAVAACLLAVGPAPALAAAGAVQAPLTAPPGAASVPTSSGGTAGNPLGGSHGTSTSTGAHVTTVKIVHVSCVPAASCGSNAHQVSTGGTLLLQGVGLRSGMIVAFPKTTGATISSASPASRLRVAAQGLIVTVPRRAHSGRIVILLGEGRHTSSFGPISIVGYRLHPPAPKPSPPPPPSPTLAPSTGSPLDGQGMWIWYVNQSDGGNVSSIIAKAHANDVGTVLIKSSDGSTNYWGQFSRQLVAELHAAGLKVCAWQYVYGTNPTGEADLGAEAVGNGADCLVIDAESEYEGHYAAAQTYITTLRAKIGPSYPLALASFPYVSYHESFPYSVFLGPEGAQYNAPQMYWHDIGVSVDTVYANTYIANRIYDRPIFPLGQTYGGVSFAELLRFREEAVDYGAGGISFWDWQETVPSGWGALAAPLTPLTTVTPNAGYPELEKGSTGDQVLWLQEHLADAIPSQEVTGSFGSHTVANLETFQAAHGLPVTGTATAASWTALLALPPVPVHWTGSGPSG